MEIPFLFRGGQMPEREANARQRDSVVCEQENRCRFLNVVSSGETPRTAKHGLILRARRMVWRLPIPPFRGRALHEHRGPTRQPIIPISWRCRGRTFSCWNGAAIFEGLETVCETRRTKASFTRSPGGFEDGWSSESVRVMPFYYGKRSASICVVLGPKNSSTYSSEYASVFFEPAASQLPAAPLLRNEGLLGQTPSPIARRQ
jgi:hypothetical protein